MSAEADTWSHHCGHLAYKRTGIQYVQPFPVVPLATNTYICDASGTLFLSVIEPYVGHRP